MRGSRSTLDGERSAGDARSIEALVVPLLLTLLGIGAMAVALLGPLGLELIAYHASPGALEQVRGGDVAGLLLVAPVSLVAAWWVATGRTGAHALALAPASYGLYLYTQLAITGDIAQYDGNSERWFALFWVLIVTCLATLVLSGRRLTRTAPPRGHPRLERAVGWYLLVVAAFLTMGLHLPGLADAWRDSPASEEYLADPVVFWVVKVMDLAYVVPVVVAVGIGLLRGLPWARTALAPVTGWCALLASSVAGMGVTMLVADAPGASVGLAVGFTVAAAVALGLAVVAYRSLPTGRRPGRESSPP